MESSLCQTSAGSVEPEVTARLTEDGLVILMHLLPADATGVDGRGGGVLLVEDDWLVRRVDGVPAQWSSHGRGWWPHVVQGWWSHAGWPHGGWLGTSATLGWTGASK